MDKKAFGGNVGIKVDIANNFDTLNWNFLRHVLSSFDTYMSSYITPIS